MTVKRNERGWPLGEATGNARLQEDDIPRIWSLRVSGMSYQQIALALGHTPPVSWRTVADVLAGRTWTHVLIHPDILEAAEQVTRERGRARRSAADMRKTSDDFGYYPDW